MEIPLHQQILRRYVSVAPLPLAFERFMEAKIYAGLKIERPVLDVGCGEGLFAKIVFAEPLDTGIDPNQSELRRARELNCYRELLGCMGDSIPKPDGSFKTIISNSVLEHIPDLDPVLKEIRRLLSPDGDFYCTVPSDNFDQYSVLYTCLSRLGLSKASEAFRTRFNRFWRHYHYYSVDGWRQMMQRNGLSVANAFTYAPRRVCLLNDALVPLSAGAFISKRMTNRWTWCSRVRSILLSPVCRAAERFLRNSVPAERGGLIFLHCRRSERP